MARIRDVSKIAGVSAATVSRALSRPDMVSKKTRDKVFAAVEKTGYRPNLMARNLRKRKAHNIVVLVPEIANPFFSRVISGIQATARIRGYSVLLGNTQGKAALETEYADLVRDNLADGVIQLRAFYPFNSGDFPNGATPPIVNACECFTDPPCPTVQLDNHGAARAMTDHLIGLGHRRIGVIKGPGSSPLTISRLDGYEEALELAGIDTDKRLVCSGDFTMAAGHRAAGSLLSLSERPTAIFCENDEMAIGAMQRIKQIGLKIPNDISVAGFDNITYASFSDPMLTTISQPAEDLGRVAVNMLLELIEGGEINEPHQILPYDLVVRDSTATASH